MVFYDKTINDLFGGVAIDNLPGPSFLLIKDFVDKINVLDEAYFLYCEEADLGVRAKKNLARSSHMQCEVISIIKVDVLHVSVDPVFVTTI